jgi:hypothetical protein
MFDPNLVEVWTCEVSADLTLQADTRDGLVQAVMAWLMSQDILAQPFGLIPATSPLNGESAPIA